MLFGLSGAWWWAAPGLVGLVVGLGVLAVVDIREQRLPRRLTALTAALSLPWLALAAVVAGEPVRLVWMMVGAAVLLALFGVARTVSAGGFGEGDVRLAPLLGAALGWAHPMAILVGPVVALGLASLVGLVLLARGRMTRHDALALGPFMVVGTLAVMAFSPAPG